MTVLLATIFVPMKYLLNSKIYSCWNYNCFGKLYKKYPTVKSWIFLNSKKNLLN